MKTWNRNKPAAFTLLEVMVAVLILAVALTAIFQLQGQSAAMCSRARFDTTAPLLASKKMAELMTAEEDDLESGSGSFGEDYPEYTWRAEVEEVESEILEDSAKYLRKISLAVIYGDQGHTYTVQSFRFTPW